MMIAMIQMRAMTTMIELTTKIQCRKVWMDDDQQQLETVAKTIHALMKMKAITMMAF